MAYIYAHLGMHRSMQSAAIDKLSIRIVYVKTFGHDASKCLVKLRQRSPWDGFLEVARYVGRQTDRQIDR